MNRFSSVSRRVFLKTSALASAAAIARDFSSQRRLAADAPQASLDLTAAPSWTDKPMRWAQLTLVEDDPGKFDPQFWLDYFKRTRSDAVCLSAGGCVAYYPTRVPFHHRSQWLGDRDSFGDLVAGCRKLGMVVIARTDPHATYDDVHDAHPDWIVVDASGQPRRHWASPELWVTCGLGPYNFEFMTEVKREIMSRYKVDAIFINRWDGSGMCYCGHCRKHFKEASGFELPLANDPQDPARRAYLLWRQQRLFDLWRLWDREVRKINPNACVIPNTGGGATSSLDMKKIGELAPTLIADRQARRGLTAPWANGKNGKEFRATMGRKPIVGIFSVGLEEPYRWKDSVQSEAEIRLWVADGVANGLDVIPLHLCVRPAAVLEGLPPHLGAVDPSVFRRLRAGRPDARSGVGRTPAICEQHALKARADAALRKERPGLLVYFDHGGEVPQLGRPADVLEPGKIEGPVFRDELDVVKHAALPNEFDHRGPSVQQVGPQCGPACFQQFTKLVAPHGGSPSSSSSFTCSTPRPIERNLQRDRSLP